jgi:hypothetical protein
MQAVICIVCHLLINGPETALKPANQALQKTLGKK